MACFVRRATDAAAGWTTVVRAVSVRPPERAAGKVLEGEIEDVTPELVKLLREEAKVI